MDQGYGEELLNSLEEGQIIYQDIKKSYNVRVEKRFCKKLGIYVAVKVVEKKNEELIKQLKRQYQIHSMMNCDQIVRIYGMAENQHNIFLIMEYCEKGNLYDVMQDIKKIGEGFYEINERVSEYLAYKLVKDMAKAFRHMHKNNICHRDFKSDNIMASARQFKIADFGSSKDLSEGFNLKETQNGGIGNLYYKDPKHLKRQCFHMDQNCCKRDIWGLGILLFALLTGQDIYPRDKTLTASYIQEQQTKTSQRLEERRSYFEKFLWPGWFPLLYHKILVIDQKKRTSSEDLLKYLRDKKKDFYDHLRKKYGGMFEKLQKQQQKTINIIEKLSPFKSSTTLKILDSSIKKQQQQVYIKLTQADMVVNLCIEQHYRLKVLDKYHLDILKFQFKQKLRYLVYIQYLLRMQRQENLLPGIKAWILQSLPRDRSRDQREWRLLLQEADLIVDEWMRQKKEFLKRQIGQHEGKVSKWVQKENRIAYLKGSNFQTDLQKILRDANSKYFQQSMAALYRQQNNIYIERFYKKYEQQGRNKEKQLIERVLRAHYYLMSLFQEEKLPNPYQTIYKFCYSSKNRVNFGVDFIKMKVDTLNGDSVEKLHKQSLILISEIRSQKLNLSWLKKRIT